MSKGFTIGLMAAMVFVPFTVAMSFAEESQTQATLGCCDKEKQCCDNSTACKCTDCKNADCDVKNCACDGPATSNCRCTTTECANCDESGCHCTSSESSDCSRAACAAGECASQAACDALSVCDDLGNCGCAQESALKMIGRSLFGAAPATTSEITWQILADELNQSPCRRCESVGVSSESTKAVAAIYSQPTPGVRESVDEHRSCDTVAKPSAEQIQYSIQIVEDRQSCMCEYESLRRGMPMMIAESKTLLPAVRVMNKHQLVRQVSSPKLTCVAGQTAQLEIGAESPAEGSDAWSGVRLAVACEQVENGLMVELAMHATCPDRNLERQFKLLVEPGQTVVLNTGAAPPATDEPSPREPSVYVLLTPEVVE